MTTSNDNTITISGEDIESSTYAYRFDDQTKSMIPDSSINRVDDEFELISLLEPINLDDEKKNDIYSGNGFIVSAPKSIKKDIKDPDGLFSTKFGQRLGDANPYSDRFRCQCGKMRYKINSSLKIICPNCHQPVKFVGDNYEYFGWIPLIDYYIIHPNLYKFLEVFFGQGEKSDKSKDKGKDKKPSKLKNMLNYSGKFDQDGHELPLDNFPQDQPYFGIGMIDFHDKFDEIMEYYLRKYPKKKPVYDHIMENRDKVFIQSIPVFTTLLRPLDIKDGSMFYEPINGIYNMMNTLAHRINRNRTRMDRKKKPKNQLLFDLQMKYMELYKEIEDILSGKKGKLRGLVGARFNFSARAVIAQNPDLRIDQITLPYAELVITQQQKIINILHRTYNMSIQEAHHIWERAKVKKDPRVYDILMSIIKSYPEGLPVLINRNPTICYGSILQMYCVGITDTLTMGIPLQVLRLLVADFDGDCLNIFHIINDAFAQRCIEIFNPRNAMYLSRVDGNFNIDVCPQRDSIININTFIYLGRDKYSPEQMAKINAIRARQKEVYGL